MIRTLVIPLLAIAGVLLAVITVVQGSKPVAPRPPVAEPPRAPYQSFVAGSGLVEASTQNISVGTPVGGVVAEVMVGVGADVERGRPLFRIDSRELEAELASRRARLEVAKAALAKMRLGTRAEELPVSRARVAEMDASVADMRDQLAMWERVEDSRAVTAEELSRRRFAVATAQARLDQARASLALLEAGSWSADVAIAEAEAHSAQAQADAIQVELERRVVRSPIDGRVLQVNVRPGEFAAAGPAPTPLMVVGGVRPLHVRVDVDEHDAWRVSASARARAFVRGNKDLSADLAFVRFEPFVIPKRSLTGESTERVDTRVLQVIYAFDPKDLGVYVGQQMDAYIEAAAPDHARAGSTPGTGAHAPAGRAPGTPAGTPSASDASKR